MLVINLLFNILKFKQLHKFVLQTSSIVFIVFVSLLALYFFLFDLTFNFQKVLIFTFILFLLLFLSIKYLLNRFINKQIQKIYDSSSFVNEINLDKKNLEPDFESFLKKINEFVKIKHQEIEKLHSREDFRKEFLGNVSHELKTPLFTAQGYLLTVLDNSIEDKKLRKKYLERANKSIERLNFIVKDLDMIANLESGMKLDYETFNIIKLISDVFDILEIKAAKRKITLMFDKAYEFPLLVNADIERIEQVLINLIVNSISYGKDNGITTVGVKLFSKNKFIIKVSDNGIGIKNKNLSRLFERFYRVDKSRSREGGGSGLGLSIVKHIIEAHNQLIFVDSKFGDSSSFSFTINKVI